MSKQSKLLILLLWVLAPCIAQAQVYEETDYDFRARFSLELEKKLAKRLKLKVSEEFRMKENLSVADRSYTSLSLEYKACPYLRLGAEYTLMALHKYEESSWIWELRHRASFDITGLYSMGNFKFSLRERLQLTHRPSEMNVYQNPRNELVLRSRFKVSYSIPGSPIKPYFSSELRNTLNAVRFLSPNYSSVQGDNVEYNDIYISRLRFQPGLEWKLSRRNSLDFYLLVDRTFKKSYDAKKNGNLKPLLDSEGEPVLDLSGNQLYCIFFENAWHFSLGVSYIYEF